MQIHILNGITACLLFEKSNSSTSGRTGYMTMENEIDFTLPEWTFLDGNSHLGDTLEDRVILQHNPSFTIMEMFIQDENPVELDSSVKSKEFTYTNVFGEIETHLVAVHFTLEGDFEIIGILDKAIEFYRLFMDWEDASLIIEETSKDN